MGEVSRFIPRQEIEMAMFGSQAQELRVQENLGSSEFRKRRLLSLIGDGDLSEIALLQDRWDSTLGRRPNRSGEFENYNPVLARWGYERLETDEQRVLFRINEIQNVTTALRERNHTSESKLILSIGVDNKIHNEVFPDTSYEQVLERGRRYRAENGSNEIEREKAEIEGFKKIQDLLTSEDVKVGTKLFVISGPGFAEDTPYIHNFVDGYELAEDDAGNRYVQYARYASSLSYEDYQQITSEADSNYFDGKEGPVDAWYLANPIQAPDISKSQSLDEAFSEIFVKDVKAMEEERFQELYKIYLPFILYYLDQLTAEDFNPVEVAKAYNTLLLSTEDKDIKSKTKRDEAHMASNQMRLDSYTSKNISEIVMRYGHRNVTEVKAGCGSSSGFSIGRSSGKNERGLMLLNSVSGFGIDNYGSRTFNCPSCLKENLRPEGELLSACQHCGSQQVSCSPSDEPAESENNDAHENRYTEYAQAA